MILDTNPRSLEIQKKMIQSLGIKNVSCFMFWEFEKELSARDSETGDFTPDLMILNSGKGKHSGMDLVQRIGKASRFRETRIILAGNVLDESLRNANTAGLGIRAILPKPYKLEEILFYLVNLKSNSIYSSGTKSIRKSESISKNFQICIAEDNELNYNLIQKILMKMAPNASLFHAENGSRAFEIFRV